MKTKEIGLRLECEELGACFSGPQAFGNQEYFYYGRQPGPCTMAVTEKNVEFKPGAWEIWAKVLGFKFLYVVILFSPSLLSVEENEGKVCIQLMLEQSSGFRKSCALREADIQT